MSRREKAMQHFKRIGLSDEEKLVAMRKLIITWRWLDSENQTT